MNEDEWELSKENVKPLRSGRKVSDLTTGLQADGDNACRVKEQKHTFEEELRTYDGDDPLDVWDRYIKWVEQHYPKGGKDGKLSTLLEQCVTVFREDTRYRNDERYISVWTKFAQLVTDPLEIYGFLYDQGIGCEVALFYEAWASELEHVNNTQKADAIFMDGIQRAAQPLDRLQRSHREFQARTVRQMSLDDTDSSSIRSAEPERQILGGLKPKGRLKHTVGSIRTGVVQQGARDGVDISVSKPKQKPGQGIAIFCDENTAPAAAANLPPQTGEWSTSKLPTRSAVNSENEEKPGIWTQAMVRQRHAHVVSINSASAAHQPAFNVYQDEVEHSSIRTPAKLPEVGNQILSAHKPTSHPVQQVIGTGAAGLSVRNEQPMYCKHLIYAGAEEFSFEEIRAAKWLSRNKGEAEHRAHLMYEERQIQMLSQMKQMQEQLLKQQDEMSHNFTRLRERVKEEIVHDLFQNKPASNQATVDVGHGVSCDQPADLPVAMEQLNLITKGKEKCSVGPVPTQSISTRQMFHPYRSREDQTITKQLLFEDATSQLTTEILAPKQQRSCAEAARSTNSAIQPFINPCNVEASINYEKLVSNKALLPKKGLCARDLPPTTDPSPLPVSNTQKLNSSTHTPNMSASAAGTATEMVDTANTGSGSSQGFRSWISNKTPDSGSAFHNNFGAGRQSLAGPSPTMNTKEASNLVMGMFNDSLHIDKQFEWQPPQTEYPQALTEETPSHELAEVCQIKPAHAPFEIYTENQPEPMHIGSDNLFERPHIPATNMYMEDDLGAANYSAIQQCGSSDPYIDRDDITFAPVGMTWEEAARFASTPFNPMTIPDELPEPPLSIIRHRKDSDEKIHDDDDNFQATSQAASVHTVKSFDATSMQTSQKDLSPIMECSDEDKQTIGSSIENASSMMHKSNNSTADGSSLQPNSRQNGAAPINVPSPIPEMSPANMSYHVIDTSAYVFQDLDQTRDLLSNSIIIDPHGDPFDEEIIQSLLGRLPRPISSYPGYYAYCSNMPILRTGSLLSLDEEYLIRRQLGKGGFATVYHVRINGIAGMDHDFAIKVQKPACPWEFYICKELMKRLSRLRPVDDHGICGSLMDVSSGHFYKDGSFLVTSLHQEGTLLDMVNKFRQTSSFSNIEPFAAFVMIELLKIVDNIHKCHIIHSDIKPDNFLVLQSWCDLKVSQTTNDNKGFLKLIDFGRSIDMKLYPPDTTFMAKVNTSGFMCIEMKTNQPWTYQMDLFGLAGTIHVLMFGQYMNVYQENGRWKTTCKIPRSYTDEAIWKHLFDTLLNIPSCTEIPNLTPLLHDFQDYFTSSLTAKFSSFIKTQVQNELVGA